jgi:hypothetical protein
MKELIETIIDRHRYEAAPHDAEAILRQLEGRFCSRLPDDLREYYQHFSEVGLFDDRYRLMPLSEIAPVGLLQAGEDGQGWCSPTWLAICDLWDSNYVAIDTTTSNILDCYHEDLGSGRIIAKTFSEFLTCALNSGGQLYWLQHDFQDYGRVEYEPGPEFYRGLDRDWWETLGEEIGPESCRHDECQRKRIHLSVMCRRHHYEMTKRRECPFDD